MNKKILLLSLMLAVAVTPVCFAEENAPEADKPAAAAETEHQQTPREEAVFQYSEGLRLFQDAQFHAAKGNKPAWKKVLKESQKKFESALTLYPDFPEAESNIGYVELTLEDYKHAIETFNAVLAKHPTHVGTLNGLATAYAFNNQIDESVKTFEQLTKLAPGNADYLFNYGSVLQRAKRLDDAKTVYEKALRVDPRHQRTLFNLGTLYQNQGELVQAAAYYDQAKTMDIGNTIGLEAMNRLKEVEYLKNRELQKAAESTDAEQTEEK